MNKNMLKRTWLNLIRKPSKSIILLIIIFVMANLVIAALAISNAVTESMDYAKESIGSDVYLNANMDMVKGSFMEDMEDMENMENMENMEDMDSSNLQNRQMSRPEATMNMVSEVAKSEYVKDLTYSVSAMANPIEFIACETETSMSKYSNQMKEMGISDIKITGINSYAFITEVQNNIMTISEGEYFDETTDKEIMISYELAETNEILVGDILKLENMTDGTVVEYIVRGIFTTTESGYENNIYMNVESAAQLLNDEEYNNGDYGVSNVIFYMNNPEDTENFINEVNEKYDLEEMQLILDIDSSAYDQMVGPIEQVGSFADTILIVVIVAALLIITLIINNSIKSRKYEMGVLMSLGAKKSNIIGQILLELVIIVTIGFILSIGTSTLLANELSEGLLEDQIEMSETESENNFNRPTSGNDRMQNMPMNGNVETNVETIDEIDVNIDAKQYLILFGLGYLISFIAMIIPSVNIMRYEPKTILTGRGE